METNLGNLATDAMRTATGSDIAFISGASLRNDIEPGEVTRMFLETSLLSDTPLAVLELTGVQVLAILENGLAFYPEQYFLFPHQSGLFVRFVPEAPAGERVTGVACADGGLFELHKTYSVAVLSDIATAYLAIAGTPDAPYKTTDKMLVNSVADYVRSGGVVSAEVDGRLQPRGAGYVVGFDGGGAGSGAMESIEVAYGVEMSIPACGFSNPGHSFNGWVDDYGQIHAAGDKAIDLDAFGIGTVTLTATWIADEVPGDPTADDALDAAEAGALPQTGDDSGVLFITLSVIFVLCGTIFVLLSRKQTKRR